MGLIFRFFGIIIRFLGLINHFKPFTFQKSLNNPKKPKLPQKSSFGVSGGRPGGGRRRSAYQLLRRHGIRLHSNRMPCIYPLLSYMLSGIVCRSLCCLCRHIHALRDGCRSLLLSYLLRNPTCNSIMTGHDSNAWQQNHNHHFIRWSIACGVRDMRPC